MRIRLVLAFSITLLWLHAGMSPLHAEQTFLPVHVDGAAVVRGQDSPTEKTEKKNTLGLGERFKRFFVNLTHDHESDTPPTPAENRARLDASSIPTKPPKPPTAAEVQQSIEHPEKPLERRSPLPPQQETLLHSPLTANNTPSAAGNPPLVSGIAAPSLKTDEPDASDSSVWVRLKEMRTQIFDKQTLRENKSYQDINAGTRHQHAATIPQNPAPSAIQRTPPPELPTLPNLTSNTPNTQNAQPAAETLNVAKIADADVNKNVPYSPYPQYQNANPLNPNPAKIEPLISSVDVQPGATPPAVRPEPAASGTGLPAKPETEEYPITNRRVLPSDTTPEQTADGRPQTTEELARPETPLREPVKMTDTAAERPERSTERPAADSERKVLVSPRLEVETECPPRAIVGQEAVYRIRVGNKGGASAEQVVLSVEIPDWLEILQPDVSAGTTSIVPRSGQKEPRDFVWKISRIEPNAEELLVLHLVPQQRRSVDLRIRYDFYRPQAVAKIIVQEPVLEMELQGPDEVVWGNKVQYRLVVRNTGNGDAENILLELLQTGSDMRTCPLDKLEAGKEQPIEVLVWTGKQEHIDINIQATGDFGLNAKVSKRVKVLRPNVKMTVEAPALQFVGSPAEFQIRIHNEGEATAEGLVLTANLPLGAQFVSCSDGGELTPENQIQWKIETIPIGEVFNASVICLPKREGSCKLETTVNDKSGTLAQCSGTLEAEAIVDLKLDVEYPNGPVEVGSEAIYTICIINRGMKTAENVEVVTAFAEGVEPKAVEGTNAYMSDGQVFFDKITTMAAGQKTVLKIKTKADKPGNHRVRTVVVCKPANINLVNEQATYFYQKQKEKSRTFTSTEVPSLPKPEPETESSKPEQAKPEPKVATKPAKAEPMKAEPTKSEPVKPEPDAGKQAPLDPSQPLVPQQVD